MVSLLDSYEQQYGSITSEITAKIGTIPRLSHGEKKSECSHVDRLFEESKELLEQMELEIHDLPAGIKQKYTTRLKSYQSELNKLEKDYRRARISFRDETLMRDELLGHDTQHTSEDQRQRLLDNTERLERGSKKLEQGYSMTQETEKVGAAILEDLNHQRETIQRSRDRLREVNQDIGKSSRILTGMLRRIVQNRVLLILIAAIMLLVIGATIYFVSRKDTVVSAPPPAKHPPPAISTTSAPSS